MMMVSPKFEITFGHELSDYEMRMLGEAIALCDLNAEVRLNGEPVVLDDMLAERNTWDVAWNRFDAEQGTPHEKG